MTTKLEELEADWDAARAALADTQDADGAWCAAWRRVFAAEDAYKAELEKQRENTDE